MQQRLIPAVLVMLAMSMTMASPSAVAEPSLAEPPLAASDVRAAKSALKYIAVKRWSKAGRQIGKIKSPLTLKIFRWIRYSRPSIAPSFSQITSFVEQNPDWPDSARLLRRAEAAIPAAIPARQLLSWFKKFPPVSTQGRVALAASLLATGKIDQARSALREVWINGNFTRRDERIFYKRYRKHLTRGDHVKRMERLIWADKYWPARRMLWKVKPPYRTLAEARLMLMRQDGNVDTAIAKVPPQLRDHPGLVYERLRWRRRKGKDDSARELLSPAPADMVHPEKWWKERAVLVRSALRKGFITDAYRISKEHGLSQGKAYAEAEWLAGWIALRFLQDHKIALAHFTDMYGAVKYPISRARGAYWAGRAAEQLSPGAAAEKWYAIAASYPATYYGQLAFARINPGGSLKLPADHKPAPGEKDSFAKHELVKAAFILKQIGGDEPLKPFIKAIGAIRNTPGWLTLTADLAAAIKRPDLAVVIAKMANKSGWLLSGRGYPMLDIPRIKTGKNVPALELSLVLAMIRQESAFYNDAKSRTGARGLLQLMPSTARNMAKKLRLPYSRQRLLSDPDYNMKLGQSYLAGLVRAFDGSYVLTLAAYNAGPARARKWMRRNGDPREQAVDAIDWIELIPFGETRNYVQRVLEHLQMYRLKVSQTEIALRLEDDLHK